MFNNLGFDQLPKVGSDMKGLISDIDNFLNEIDSEESTENLKENLKQFVFNVSEFSSRLLNTMRANVTQLGDKLKRSEIVFYSESHPKQVTQIEGMSYDVVRNVIVPVPAGLSVTCFEATDTLNTGYDKIEIESVVKNSATYFEEIYKKILSSENNTQLQKILQSSSLGPMADGLRSKATEVEKISFQSDKQFGDTRIKGKKPFKTAYESMEEFRMVRSLLKGMQIHLKRVSTAVEGAANVDKVVGNIMDVVQNTVHTGAEVPELFVKESAQLIKTVASIFDVYGVFAKRQASLEHNHVLTLEELNKLNKIME